jgi:hypothetical protein
MRSGSVTVVFDERREIENRESIRGRLRSVGRWLADQWPKAAIAFGFALTVVWTAVLGWLVARVFGLV